MEMEGGKLFIGGISWDTSEERLKEYFQTFGEVVEAVIMKDRATGRARGFGFIVFANASVAEKVARERHVIDGRIVEAKKAVPRDDHQSFTRSNSSIHGSLGPARTKKIFVGGLASTVTETDFKRYFDQFGIITDVVVMYDHNTQRPRGFGFITYDSEEAVDKVLIKTFHELNGKMVEVKRAVPKELSSPGQTRSPSAGYNYGLHRGGSMFNAYTPGGYMRMDGRFSPVTVGRSGYPPYSPSNHNMGQNLDSGFSSNYRVGRELGVGYGNGPDSYFSGNSNQYGSPIAGYNGGNGSLLRNTNRDMWSNGGSSYGANLMSSNSGIGSTFGNVGEIWGFSRLSDKGDEGGNVVSGREENGFGGRMGYIRNNEGTVGPILPYSVTSKGRDEVFGNLYGSDPFYDDHGWLSSSQEHERPVSFGYGGANAAADVASNNGVGYVGGYSVAARSNRGIAA